MIDFPATNATIPLLILTLGIILPDITAAESYSPHVDQSYATDVYWGDTHVHTHLSWDAYSKGNRLTPDEANRFAKGEDGHRRQRAGSTPAPAAGLSHGGGSFPEFRRTLPPGRR